MPVNAKDGMNKDLEFLSSKGLADISKEGLAPETTDSVMMAEAMSDRDSIGEDTNAPSYPEIDATGLPMAENMGQSARNVTKNAKSIKGI